MSAMEAKVKKLFALFLSLLSAPALATSWYVSTTGSDANSGTSLGAAYATFPKAQASALAGDTVFVVSGTYNQPIIYGPAGVNRSGTAGNLITWTNVPGTPHPVISNVGSTKYAMVFSSVAYITIDGIDVDGQFFTPFANTNSAIRCTAASFASGGAPNVGFFATIENSNHIVIQNNNLQRALGYNGIQIASNYLASGQPWFTNVPAVLTGHTSYVTVQNNFLDKLGNLLETQGLCGDMISLGHANNYVSNVDHILIQNNVGRHANHDMLISFATSSIIQNNDFNNSWKDLYPAGVPQGKGLVAGYRLFEMIGADQVLQNNLLGPSGCCAGGNSNIPPLGELHGLRLIGRRNVLHDSVANAINMDCGYGGADNVQFMHVYHNTFYKITASPLSAYFYTIDPCVVSGNHTFVNNLYYETRMNPASVPSIVVKDTDVFTEPTGNGGLGNISQNFFGGSLWAPSLTSPSNVSTRPASFYNLAITGQQPICLAQANTTACPNTAPAIATFPTYITADNIDAGITPAFRPQFVSPSPSAYSDYGLQGTSPGVDQARDLTTTTAGGTAVTSIPVADVGYFSDGFGLIAGDSIELHSHGTITVVTAKSATQGPGTLTVSPAVTFNNGEGIDLVYTGLGPDIGAIEIGAPSGPPVAQPKTWSLFLCQSDGKVYSDPSRCH